LARRRRVTANTATAQATPTSSPGAGASTFTEQRRAMAAQQENALAEGSSRRVILAIVLAVFVIFEISIILIFRTGEEIHWKKELTRIEAIYNRGEYKSAAERMTQFGKDWPGAVQTFDWNKKMGLYHAKAEDWATAAAHYARAAQIDAEGR
jgi:hypothetical protein